VILSYAFSLKAEATTELGRGLRQGWRASRVEPRWTAARLEPCWNRGPCWTVL